MSWLDKEIDRAALARCLFALSPFLLIALLTGNVQWQHALIPASATLIGVERVGLTVLGVLGQELLIVVCFVALLFAQETPALFVADCAILAALSVALTAHAQRLRSLGTFVFVPALYMACEVSRDATAAQYPQLIGQWLPYVLTGCVPVIVLALFDQHRAIDPVHGNWRHWCKLHLSRPLGPALEAGLPTLAVALSVATAATLVIVLHPDNPQWIIWSAASVVAGDLGSSQRKIRDRLYGALAGVPLGVLLGSVLPHRPLVGVALGVFACATVFAFRRYVVSFAARCVCAACAIVIAHHTLWLASERFFNVALGGLIGAGFVFALYFLFRGDPPCAG